jgi:hypothetical protein
MQPHDIRSHADHRLTTLRSRARRDRLAPLAGRIRTGVAGGLRTWATRIDGRTQASVHVRGAA